MFVRGKNNQNYDNMMCCETPPFGHLGVSQRTKWGMINGLTGHQSKVQRRSFGGSRAEKWGAESSLNAQNLCKKRKKTIHFAIFRARKTASFIGIKHGGKHIQTSVLPLRRILISNTLHCTLPPFLQWLLPRYNRYTMQWVRICICNCIAFSVFSFQLDFFAMSTTPKNWQTDFIIYI